MIPKTIRDLLFIAQQDLAFITDQPALEAEVLLAFTLDKPRTYFHAWPNHHVPFVLANHFFQYIARRCNKEPIAYITNKKEFWSLDLEVTTDTLIPRPETELLVEVILAIFPHQSKIKIADLGTGSGAIALALASERPTWEIHALDVSENALTIARKNAQRLGLDQISFYSGNWCTALPCSDFDIIVSNPPYIAETEWEHYQEGLMFEPRQALLAGIDGLTAIREISHSARQYLKPGGCLFLEHGFSQGEKVRGLLAENGYTFIQSKVDLSGQERVTMAKSSLS